MEQTSLNTEGDEARALISSALTLARGLSVGSLIAQAQDRRDVKMLDKARDDELVVWLVPPKREEVYPKGPRDVCVPLPTSGAASASAVSIGLLQAVLSGHVGLDETVLCLSGGVGGKRLDTLMLTNPRRDFPWLGDPRLAESFRSVVSQELARVIAVCLRFAREGREGRPIGTIFLLGDSQEVQPFLRQMILNPCAGHVQRTRSIHDPELFETLRELAALDGAFVVDRRGIVRSAGTYLDAPSSKLKIPEGFGARHRAAAAITAATAATSVCVSESSGTVTVFHGGERILSLERT